MADLMLAKVTRKGQITIPQELRKALGVETGDYVALRPVVGGVFMSKASDRPANTVPHAGVQRLHQG